jgi:hypothetical protein
MPETNEGIDTQFHTLTFGRNMVNILSECKAKIKRKHARAIERHRTSAYSQCGFGKGPL